MAAVTVYTASARRWSKGWELHVDGVGVTQVRSLDKAEQQVRDLVETMTGQSADGLEITIRLPDLEDYTTRVQDARATAERAAADAAAAAAEMRAVVVELRDVQHLASADIAAVLGVSRGRVSQLSRP